MLFLMEWERPTIVMVVWSFLGLVVYYRQFVQDFSAIATPMTKLTMKGAPFCLDC
jgi:hypothetical protein